MEGETERQYRERIKAETLAQQLTAAIAAVEAYPAQPPLEGMLAAIPTWTTDDEAWASFTGDYAANDPDALHIKYPYEYQRGQGEELAAPTTEQTLDEAVAEAISAVFVEHLPPGFHEIPPVEELVTEDVIRVMRTDPEGNADYLAALEAMVENGEVTQAEADADEQATRPPYSYDFYKA